MPQRARVELHALKLSKRTAERIGHRGRTGRSCAPGSRTRHDARFGAWGKQDWVDTGPLDRKRMETNDTGVAEHDRVSGRMLALLLAAGAALTAGGTAAAQSVESDLAPDSERYVRDSSHYAVPGPSDRFLSRWRIDDGKDRFSFKFGLAALWDYTFVDQDEASLLQVGEQQDDHEVRSLRFTGRGHVELFRRWNYNLTYEYKGFDKDPGDADWSATDLYLATEIGPRLGTLRIGKQKEPFAYEMVGDAANLPHPERWLSPFFVSRSVGVQLSNVVLEQRATWTVGWYNDWWTQGDSFSESGNDFAARVTALPLWREEGESYLHLGASVRYYGADDDELRYRGRPASNVVDYYVDTGVIPGDHAWHTGLEALWALGGWSVLGEYARADLHTDDGSDPSFDGWYVTATWVPTGEHRPYDRKVGYARRVLPQGRWGALELMARYGRVDATDSGVEGGEMEGWWAGVNWWATRRWKFSLTYGDVDLEKDGVVGNTETLLGRVQWIY
jgi:phosphate-selective porin